MLRSNLRALLVVGSLWLLALPGALVPAHAQPFVEFESGQVRPLALSPDGTRLFAVNTPDGQLEVFDVTAGGVTHAATVPVGLEPVAVAARTNTEVWVVNHLSDSISIVDLALSPPRVVQTLLTCDEPRDIVFAGAGRAFVTTARRGQNCPVPPNFTTEGTGRAVVQVFDGPGHGGSGPGGTPVANIVLFGDTPRALAVAPGGGTVYAAVFHSGNQTTAVNEGIVCNGGAAASACSLDGVIMPGGLGGGQVPGGLPAPSPLNCSSQSEPETGLIVRFDTATGIWKDELGRNWNNAVRFSLPDQDVFSINASTLVETGTPWAHVGTILFNMVANPATGKIYVSNTEARNEVRFEGPGTCSTTVRGHLHEARITVLDGAAVLPRHLNKHLTYGSGTTPLTEQAKSFAIPLGMAVTTDGTTLYMTAFGSSQVGVFNTAQLETNAFVPTASNHITVTGGGPSGLVLDEAHSRLYVFTRFDNALSVINTTTAAEIDHQPLFNPEPASITDGRRFLYDSTATSSNGEASCASCHIFGDFDSLAWDLGNPSDNDAPNPNPFRVGGGSTFASMKGPMTTQTLRGMSHSGPMHWRGDRTGGSTGGDPLDEHAAFVAFNVAFDGLLGRAGPISATDMNKFTDFILQVTLPPNPKGLVDGLIPSDAAAGRTQFTDPFDLTDLVQPCDGCHVLDPPSGFFGTDGRMSIEGETQEFKIPHLRNLYQKVGMFGMPQSPFLKPGNNGDQGPQIRGFGFLHDGSIDTLFRFHRAAVFNLTTLEAQNMEQFMLEFPSDLAPAVGQQITLTSTSPAGVDDLVTLLVATDDVNFCELTVKGPIGGQERGWVRLASGMFRSDRASEPLLTPTQLHDQALVAGQERTYTCVPVGSGTRIGVDRDLDGCFDRDELDLGSDPTDAGSNGCLTGSTTTTTTTGGSTTTSTTLPPPLCGPVPATGCRAAATAKSTVLLKDASDDLKDVFKWKWKGGGTATGDFKDPVGGTASYRVCVYDASAANQPLLEAGLVPGGTCSSKPCWKATGTTGFKMTNKAGAPSGITKALFKAGTTSPNARVVMGAKGVNIPMPALGLTLPVTVQLIADDGTTECWQTVYTASQKNDALQFKAKGP